MPPRSSLYINFEAKIGNRALYIKWHIAKYIYTIIYLLPITATTGTAWPHPSLSSVPEAVSWEESWQSRSWWSVPSWRAHPFSRPSCTRDTNKYYPVSGPSSLWASTRSEKLFKNKTPGLPSNSNTD